MNLAQAKQEYISTYVEKRLADADENLYQTDSDSGYTYLNSRGERYAEHFEAEAKKNWEEAHKCYEESILGYQRESVFDTASDYAWHKVGEGHWEFSDLLADLLDEAYHEII
jgi:hypothetical protein